MKAIHKGVLFLVVIFFTLSVKAQNKYGVDSTDCIKNMSLYMEYYKHKNYKEAVSFWRKVKEICPQAHKSIYLDGAKMYRSFIKKEKDSIKQHLLIDTLFNIYDSRIKYYGQQGFVLGRKGTDFMRFRNSDINTAYSILSKSVDLQKNKSEAAAIVALMNASVKLNRNNKLSSDTVIKNYFTTKAIAEHNIEKGGRSLKVYTKALARIDKIGSKYLDCNTLLEMYQAKYKNDSTKLGVVVAGIEKAHCIDSDFYNFVFTKLVEQNLDSIDLVYKFAGKALKKKDFLAAKKYYSKSLQLYNLDSKINLNIKADIYYGLAQACQGLGKYDEGRTNAEEAIKVNPNNGLPLLLIGDMYAASNNCGANEFENKAVYWLAVDTYRAAKITDPTLTNTVAKKIATYSKRFPTKETAFFNGFQNGQTYKIGCWINKTTTVKLK